MLNLATLHTYLSQLITPPSVHTALLISPEGALVSYATDPAHPQPKDEVWAVAALAAETWAETRAQTPSVNGEEGGEEGRREEADAGMVESELGRVVVVPVEPGSSSHSKSTSPEGETPSAEPILLVAVNGLSDADWEGMVIKSRSLARYLAPSVNKHRETAGIMGGAALSTSVSIKPLPRTRSAASPHHLYGANR